MNINRYVKIDGHPSAALQRFLFAWWESYGLEALYAPVLAGDGSSLSFQRVTVPGVLSAVNPFLPLMQANAAPAVRRFAQEDQGQRAAAILRPCELRAYVELEKRNGGVQNIPILIGIDCLGTYAQEEYNHRLSQLGINPLSVETWENGSQGGVRSQPVRMACQICNWPAPRGADLVIGYLGVPAEAGLLIITPDEERYLDLAIAGATDGFAPEGRISRRESVVGAIADLHAGVRRKYLEHMQGMCRFDDLGCLLAWLANCTLCGRCLDACPLVEEPTPAHLRRKPAAEGSRSLITQAISVGRQLACCSGCGMCAAACQNQVPLMLVISALSHAIQDEFHYLPGEPATPLPWQSVHAW